MAGKLSKILPSNSLNAQFGSNFHNLASDLNKTRNQLIAILRGYTSIDDPVVAKIRQLLELMRTENMTVSEAAHSVEVPLEVLASLARLVREERGLLV